MVSRFVAPGPAVRAPFAAILLTGCVLSLGACASLDPGQAPAVLAESSAPAAVSGYDWFLNTDADQASLAYGLKDSDDVRLGLECQRGAGRVELSAEAAKGVREIYLESGGDTDRFAAQGEPSELHDGDFLTAAAKTDAPIFQRFRRVGWLAKWQGDRREMYAAHAESLPAIDRFFSFCG